MVHKIAILGDFNPAYSTHHALNDSIRQIKNLVKEEIQFDWIATDIFNCNTAFNHMYSGLWIAPGSPYKDMENVLDAIAYTRKNKVPTFGNCGGFQHMVIELARNVCGIVHADHEETNPNASDLVISKLSCSLIEQEENLTIVDKNSILYETIMKEKLLGKYFCNYGINNKYIETLQTNGLKITAVSDEGHARAFELENHPFFLGTLFQPALTSTMDLPNPLIVEFIKQSIKANTFK